MPEARDGISVLVSTLLSVLQRRIHLPASLHYVQGSDSLFLLQYHEGNSH